MHSNFSKQTASTILLIAASRGRGLATAEEFEEGLECGWDSASGIWPNKTARSC